MKSCNLSWLRFHMSLILNHSIKYARQMPSLIQVFCLARQGCILNLKFMFAPPPLFDLYFCPKWNLIKCGGACRRRKIFRLFCGILYIFSKLGKKYAYFLPIGEKYEYFLPIGEKICIPPPLFFCSLSIIFFPQHVIWPGGGGVKQIKKHPWV